MEIISYVTTGLFQGKHTEHVLKEFSVPLPCLTKQDSLTLRFPLSLKDDFRKVKILAETTTPQKDSLPPVFEMEIVELSNLLTNFAFNPNRDIEEDRQRLTIYNKKQIQMTQAKLMLQIFNILELINLERLIFFYKYPRFSNMWLCLLIFFTLTFDAGHMLAYLLGVFIVIFTLLNEKWYSKVRPIFERLFFRKVNPYFNEGLASQIKTIRQDTIEKHHATISGYGGAAKRATEEVTAAGKKGTSDLREAGSGCEEEEGGDINQFQRQKKGLLQEYAFFKDKVLWVMYFLDIASSFVEKTHKLLNWQDKQTSATFLIMLFVIFFVVAFLPLRFFVVLACKLALTYDCSAQEVQQGQHLLQTPVHGQQRGLQDRNSELPQRPRAP